ncbi:hypothetical protein PG994_011646 [Apiospora phragmitis]|uniref:Uncharacterized protein n=1 Tax=Apiospora phragmitis TaxID=2905665 RepID=A0ABR1TTD2_9PEZI
MTVSNRGVQFVAPARKFDRQIFGRGYEIFHVQLACKEVGFDMKPRLRAGIYLAKRFGTGDTWSRIWSTELPSFESWTKYEVNSFFVLKERSSLQDLMLAGGIGDVTALWVRTLPPAVAWPYRLAFAYPPYQWDERNKLFQGFHWGKQEPFVLAFRKSMTHDTSDGALDENPASSYFLVVLGIRELDQQQLGEWSKQHIWFQIKCRGVAAYGQERETGDTEPR